MVSKNGLIRTVEAVVAVLLVIGALLVISAQRTTRTDEDLGDLIPPILEEIAKNQVLRDEVIGEDLSALSDLETFVGARIDTGRLEYAVRICELDELCFLEPFPSDFTGEVFSGERVLSSSINNPTGEPKRVKIFLWRISN